VLLPSAGACSFNLPAQQLMTNYCCFACTTLQADKLAEDSLVADHYVADLTAAAAKAPAKKPPAKKPAKPAKPAVACTSKINWESINGGVHLNGKPFHIKVSPYRAHTLRVF
jgi:hypothetical protein